MRRLNSRDRMSASAEIFLGGVAIGPHAPPERETPYEFIRVPVDQDPDGPPEEDE